MSETLAANVSKCGFSSNDIQTGFELVATVRLNKQANKQARAFFRLLLHFLIKIIPVLTKKKKMLSYGILI